MGQLLPEKLHNYVFIPYLRWSPDSSPLCILQCAHSLGTTHIWEVHLSADAAAFIQRHVPAHSTADLLPPYACCQTPDTGIYMTNGSHGLWKANLTTRCAEPIVPAQQAAQPARTQSTVVATLPTDAPQSAPTTPKSKSQIVEPANLSKRHSQMQPHVASTAASVLSEASAAENNSSVRVSRMSLDELFADGTDDRSGLLNIIRPNDPLRTVFLFAYRGGIGLIQQDGLARFYRRLTGAQTQSGQAGWAEWFNAPPLGETVVAYVCVHMKNLYVYTASGRVLRLQDNDEPVTAAVEQRSAWIKLREYGREFTHCVLVQPMGDLLVAVTALHEVMFDLEQT